VAKRDAIHYADGESFRKSEKLVETDNYFFFKENGEERYCFILCARSYKILLCSDKKRRGN
jgi:hypothetical protein